MNPTTMKQDTTTTKEDTTMKQDTTIATTTTMKEGNTMKQEITNIALFESIAYTNSKLIPFVRTMRSNERVLVYDIRCAIINNNFASLLSLVKAWAVMVKKPDTIDNSFDNGVIAITRELVKLAYTGKKASVKARKDGEKATIDVLNTGRIKAWLYTLAEGRFMYVAEAGDRPEEKKSTHKVSEKKTIRIDGIDYDIATIRGLVATIK